jgi:uncharacterized repeat protein (TIGR03803 family)
MIARRLALGFFLVAAVCTLPAQTFTYSNLHSFNTTDGYTPANVIQASDGNLYGTSESGGTAADGNVFRSTLAGAVTSLYSFCAANSSCPDGKFPEASVIQATNGNLYGTTSQGGAYANGSIFELSSTGSLTTLYSFCPNAGCADGSGPNGLVQGNDGFLYGTTKSGGAYGNGAIFKIGLTLSVTSGESTIYSFCAVSSSGHCADGSIPEGVLVQGSDGNFYGVTSEGGANLISENGAGTVFKVTSAGALTTLYSFCAQGGSNCTDGQSPNSGLVEGANGSFYGVTNAGGSSGGGTAFAITSAGSLTTLYNFCTVGLCTDGIGPYGPLFLASDGNYYGVAGGGSEVQGVFFQLTTGGTETVLYPFCSVTNCTDGELLEYGPIQGSDGNFYGTTGAGGTSDAGVLYKISASPAENPPVQLSLPKSTVGPGGSFTLSYSVSNAYSDTLQYCYASNTAGNTGWTGETAGSTKSQNVALTAPTTTGSYTFALTCGGQETGIATLAVKDSTAVTMTSSLNPVQVGQTVTLSATVTRTTGTGAPTGTVSFYYETLLLGTGTVNTSGVASITADSNKVGPASYGLHAVYSGDSTDLTSTSATLNVTLNKAVTSTTLTASPTTVTPPATVTLTATVKRTASGTSGEPGGTVTFLYAGKSLGTGTVNSSGVATLTAATTTVPAGTYPVTASYGSDTFDAASTSSAVTVTVK